MLDIKQIRENPDTIQERLNRRGEGYDLQPILDLDRTGRELETQRSQIQARSNEIGKLIGQQMKSGSKPDDPAIQTLKEEGNQLKAQLSELEPRERELKAELDNLLLNL
ncbi:MAG TPA: hypothetical protein V6D27_17705, partial [Vampirovibrionales bacterium]